jgi:hypothetical protein
VNVKSLNSSWMNLFFPLDKFTPKLSLEVLLKWILQIYFIFYINKLRKIVDWFISALSFLNDMQEHH